MRYFKFLILLLFFPSLSNAELIIKEEPIQGQLLTGKTFPNASMKYKNKNFKATSFGTFAIGIGRDDKLITIQSKSTDNKIINRTIKVKSRKYEEQKINSKNKKFTTKKLSKEIINKIKKEGKEIGLSRKKSILFPYYAKSWIHPTKGLITGVYGSRRILNGEPKRPHFGIDYANKKGTLVVAPQNGVISLIQNDNYYSGNTILMDHGGGVFSAFLHLDKITVKKGDNIKQGEKIGTIGSTGRSTGPHLDWRINWYNKTQIDPALLKGINLGTNPKNVHIK